MPFEYIAVGLWRWFANTGINLALLILLALLVPRAGRFANRIAERRAAELPDSGESKSHLAIAGVGIYIAQAIAYFLILVFFLQQLGFSLAGAAIPATVVSAAIGFGAQSIIADFLAGFFILSEKQYGVGDFVTFQGNGIDVSGDVIQITMRATQIRTMQQSTISIPNSTARICINQSNYWSSAVVVVPVPLLGSDSADEAIARSEAAARRALARPEICVNVRDELAVHPAVEINPPATVGMPWTVDMRFVVRVEPLSQWMVERAIRVAILNEFWEEYGSATTIEGTRIAHVVDESEKLDGFPPTEYMDPLELPAEDSEMDSAAGSETQAVTAPAAAGEAEEDPATETLTGDSGAEEKLPRMAFGGRIRLSTALLLAAFLILLLARGLTLDPAGADNRGVLAPPPASTEPATPTTHATPTTGADSVTDTVPADTPSSTAVPAETTPPTVPAQPSSQAPQATPPNPAPEGSTAPAPQSGTGEAGGASPSVPPAHADSAPPVGAPASQPANPLG
ncbi:mechanosensitive ion channel family protein [Corynebacterium liangguodongii]|uniref:Small-conductance mechanosensitive channel n=1 Tax=Corynebacterium liangguodongii TaxID=2079535 RepID=A0A2S0WDM8_9CORY|nr:mechanosensitive ion channel family protein [Corynebacterium liangguodongii]AWB83869.1 small-conductance mechanosensitive channel [Corynebacterium liangguodongii]PWB99008.1 small-conductance mechanosensitive channel [Corynebacterium liangguodongii]